MALKLLHTADWHLGKRYRAFDPADQQTLTRARLQVIDRILDLAHHERVDAVLCAGDLFDDPQPSKDWWQGLLDSLGRHQWKDRPVFLLPGNHDPIDGSSLYDAGHPFRTNLPEGVHVVDSVGFSYELSEQAVLYAAPCRSKSGQQDPALSLPPREPGDSRFRIGLVHGQTFDVDGCQMNFPISRDAPQQRGLDYLAIGDTHGFRDVVPESLAPIVYPGAPEPTNFGEVDPGHVALVLFRRPGTRPRIRKQRVGYWTWRDVTCKNMTTLRGLRSEADLKRTVLRLTLDLDVSLAEQAELDQILSKLKGTEAQDGEVGIMVIDRRRVALIPAGDGDFPADLPEVLKAAADKLRAQSTADPLAQRALYQLYKLVHSGRQG